MMKTKIPTFKIGAKVSLINGQTGYVTYRYSKPNNNNYYIVSIPYEHASFRVFATDMTLINNKGGSN